MVFERRLFHRAVADVRRLLGLGHRRLLVLPHRDELEQRPVMPCQGALQQEEGGEGTDEMERKSQQSQAQMV